MKRIVSALLACILLVSSLFVLTSCFGGGIPNGTYESKLLGTELVVQGNTLSLTQMVDDDGIKMTYTYKLNADKDEITLTFKDIKAIGDNAEIKSAVEEAKKEAASESIDPMDFELTENGFKLAGTEYTKK